MRARQVSVGFGLILLFEGFVFRRLAVFSVFCVSISSGCAFLPQSAGYQGPPVRPQSLDTYYPPARKFVRVNETVVKQNSNFTLKRIELNTSYGPITLDYYQRPRPDTNLIFVFPVLGGRKNLVSTYFAETFARNGFDTAIVHRHNDFKDPENINRLEEILRRNVIRDRIAISFFEENYQKKKFGTFGISRGAINVAISAGVDNRLEYNVLALGGSDLVGVFKDSDERKIKKFKKTVMAQENFTEEEFYAFLEEKIKTDPKGLAQYMDSRNTLLFLALFDSSVPIEYGYKLRKNIGGPRVVYLAAGHRTSILFTSLPNSVKPINNFPIFQFDYIETEALAFYNSKFKTGRFSIKQTLFNLLSFPMNVVGRIINLFQEDEDEESSGKELKASPRSK